MKITVFTSNQPRHVSLVNRLASVCDEVFAIMECTTVFPGRVGDFFQKSDVMQAYFERVMNAEENLFGDISFSLPNVRTLPIRNGDLNFLRREQLDAALHSDVYIVFSASYVKGWLVDFLIEERAINIHMGVSPYYRGSSCNFWAMYDNRPELVGATIHLLSRGLDSGAILYHALPRLHGSDPFDFTMRAVEAAQVSLVSRIASGELERFEPVEQDRSKEIRYTRNADFTDEKAAEFLARQVGADEVAESLNGAKAPQLLRPFYI